MKILDYKEAKHFCSGYQATAGPSTMSIARFLQSIKRPNLKEGAAGFNDLRDCLLRNSERSLFLSVSNLRRSLDLMMSSSAGWAYVTLYYGAFYAASALIGMFGGHIDAPSHLVEVQDGSPGKQEFKVFGRSGFSGRSTFKGSHQIFWDLFYKACLTLQPWVDPALTFAIKPVGSDPDWQIRNRNDLNYNSYSSIELSRAFQLKFDPAARPISFPGVLNTQFEVTEGLIALTLNCAVDFGLDTDALAPLTPTGKRSVKLKDLVFNVTPADLSHRVTPARVCR